MESKLRNLVDDKEYYLFLKISESLKLLNIEDFEKEVSCHMLARAISRVYDEIDYADGYFMSFPHSWIVLPSGDIIDIYPIGIISSDGMPIMVSKKPRVGMHHNYQEKRTSNLANILSDTVFRKMVNELEERLRKIIVI